MTDSQDVQVEKESDRDMQCTSAKFVVDRIKDALWHYGIDSYKRPALNLGVLLFEFKHLASELHQETIPAATLNPVFEELIYSIENDIIFPHLNDPVVNNHILAITSYGNQKFSNLKKNERHEIEKRVNNLFDNYIVFVLDGTLEVVESFLPNGKKKKAVYNCLGDWLTEIISRGISHEGLYSLVTSRFPDTLNKVTPENVTSFISEINSMVESKKRITFEVTIKVLVSSINHLKALIKSLDGGRVSFTNPTSKIRQRFYKKERGAKWLTFRIKAIEKHSAKERAIQQCEYLMSIIVFENHNFIFEVSDSIEVKQEGIDKVDVLKRNVSALHRREDGAANDVNKLSVSISSIRKARRNENDLLPLLNGFKSHNIAVQNCDIQNQVLTIWSAFEAFIPYPKTDGSRLEYFSNYLAPIISSNYPVHLILRTLKSISTRHPSVLEHIKHTCPAENDHESLLAFIDTVLMNEDNSIHQTILSEMNGSPLDIYKYSELNKRFNDPKSTFEEISRHETKIKWQLARIYRLRNSIAHQGRAFFTVPMITEHAHTYLDKIIRLIVTSMEHDPFIVSPFDSILALKDDHTLHLSALKDASRQSGKVEPSSSMQWLLSSNHPY